MTVTHSLSLRSAAAARPEAGLRRRERWLVAVALALGGLHGLLYVGLLPPWQHYEEPSHFEFAWIISQTLSLPAYPAGDAAKRREMAASMLAHGFYLDLGFQPDFQSTEPLWIGINVSGGVPLYHVLAAGPLRLLAGATVETQLYAVRLLSLNLYLLTLWLAHKVLVEVLPEGHPLRWQVPLVMALMPGFTELMTAVSNDVAATASYSLYLWVTTRLVARGPSVGRADTDACRRLRRTRPCRTANVRHHRPSAPVDLDAPRPVGGRRRA